ncbi:MAG: carbohydrate kinase family protein [Muribaculaceae bacterium]|nr:carbohydrate kinase family protein [Muribaculaceae bacterium]
MGDAGCEFRLPGSAQRGVVCGDTVDTVGAGNSFTGAFVAGMLSGMPLREAHRLAVDTSAYVCSCAGAMPKLPESFVGREPSL